MAGLLTLRSISERSFPVPCYSLAGLVPATTQGFRGMLLADQADSRLNMAIIKLALFEFTLICSFHASFKDRKLLV